MSDDKIVKWDHPTRLDVPPERVLREAIGVVKDAVVIGWEPDGSFYFASSKADGGEVLWLLEKAKFALMEISEPENKL